MFKKILPVLALCAIALGGCDDMSRDPAKAKIRLSNGVEMPVLGFGTWQLTGEAGYASILLAIMNGYRHIDTASVYNNEKEVGRAMRVSRIPREEFFIVSKVPPRAKSYDEAMMHFNQTLLDLGTNYVDQYLIHWPVVHPLRETGDNYHAENREVWCALEDIYKSGRARSIGVSNFSINDLRNILDVATIKPMTNQIKYHIGHTPNDIVRFGRHHGIVTVGYSTLGRTAVLRSKTVQEIAAKYGVTSAQLAIRYSVQRGIVPLVKAEDPFHQVENRKVDFRISRRDMQILSELEIPSTNW
ncbi:MAG: aldo/keto reductase [Alphaproteobacteria bacterium]|nr:aldo/keto reductase [Alphaproteobacteria bacterium]MCL2890048.1 aldo/keto reductase [Alphaproteobacteria bacterium]